MVNSWARPTLEIGRDLFERFTLSCSFIGLALGSISCIDLDLAFQSIPRVIVPLVGIHVTGSCQEKVSRPSRGVIQVSKQQRKARSVASGDGECEEGQIGQA
jgi:hypothetical protein